MLGRRRECARELLAQRVDARVPVELMHARHADGHPLDDAEDRIICIIIECFHIGLGVDRPVGEGYCDACFTSDYPTETPSDSDKNRFEEKISRRRHPKKHGDAEID